MWKELFSDAHLCVDLFNEFRQVVRSNAQENQFFYRAAIRVLACIGLRLFSVSTFFLCR